MTNKVRGAVIDFPLAGAAAPTTGTYTAGTVRYNSAGTNPLGWICTVAGTPGTWKAFGAIPLRGEKTYDFPSLAAGGTTTTLVTVLDAALGDFCEVSLGVSLAGCHLTAYVSAANTVTVVLTNPTGSTVNLPSSTLRVMVTPK